MLTAAPLIRVETATPETAVEVLGDWSAEGLSASVRRKFRQAEKAELKLHPAGSADGTLCHELYVTSVSRQRGAIRYPKNYFNALCTSSASGGPVTVTKAVAPDGRVAGFLATLRQGDSVYYLHGGYRDDCAAMRPGYFLMRGSIESARDAGLRQFNFLTSPPGQPALLAYKESFGGQTSLRCHWQQPLTPFGALASWALRAISTARRLQGRAQAVASKSTSA
jgi:hypothetical protein